MIRQATWPYTVPTPQGKAPGVSGDGRLHLVVWQATTDGLTQPVFGLTYTDDGGHLIGRFTDGYLYAMTPASPLCLGTWGSEPETPATNFVPVGNTGDSYATTCKPGGFKWLAAGTVCSTFSDNGAAATFTVLRVWVEDFAQLAQGDEYTGAKARTELPQVLMRES